MCLTRADQQLRSSARRLPVKTTILCIYSNYVTSRTPVPTTGTEDTRKWSRCNDRFGERMAHAAWRKFRLFSSSDFRLFRVFQSLLRVPSEHGVDVWSSESDILYG